MVIVPINVNAGKKIVVRKIKMPSKGLSACTNETAVDNKVPSCVTPMAFNEINGNRLARTNRISPVIANARLLSTEFFLFLNSVASQRIHFALSLIESIGKVCKRSQSGHAIRVKVGCWLVTCCVAWFDDMIDILLIRFNILTEIDVKILYLI